MGSRSHADQVAGGIFLIGLALLYMFNFWWPGILFVIGASSIARGVVQGRDWYSVPGGFWIMGLGLLFLFGFQWPLLFILIGISMLFGKSWRGRRDSRQSAHHKTKHEEKAKHDSYYVAEDEMDDAVTIEDVLQQGDSADNR